MDVSKLILSNHPTTCPLDPIPTHLLQAISSSVIPALTHIINTSVHTGTFPTAFKQARITPLLKKPSLNPALLENYRPVSLLPFIAKTLERVVLNQLSMFLAQNNLLDNNQSGFKSGHSTETALLSVTNPAENRTCKNSSTEPAGQLTGSSWRLLHQEVKVHFKEYSFLMEGALDWSMVSATSVERPELMSCAPSGSVSR